jgi:hypothetical protein
MPEIKIQGLMPATTIEDTADGYNHPLKIGDSYVNLETT